MDARRALICGVTYGVEAFTVLEVLMGLAVSGSESLILGLVTSAGSDWQW